MLQTLAVELQLQLCNQEKLLKERSFPESDLTCSDSLAAVAAFDMKNVAYHPGYQSIRERQQQQK